MEGWIKLHRKFITWEWFDDSNMVKLFIYLLLSANHKDGNWRGINVERGQLITGLNSLSEKTKLSIQTLRTCLSRLEKSGEIKSKSTNKYRLITVCEYDSYQTDQQEPNSQTNKPPTSNQQSINKQLTANKNVKNYKNVKNDKNIPDDYDLIFLEWFAYKDERKEHYVDSGIKKLITQIFNKYKTAQQFKNDVDYSMAKNYKGIFSDNNKTNESPYSRLK